MYLSGIYLPLGSICSSILPVFNWVGCIFILEGFLYTFLIGASHNFCTYFLPFFDLPVCFPNDDF